MRITTGLALPIVNQLTPLLGFNINIMDDNGIIVASGDHGRIGQKHEGALHVLATQQQLLITEVDLAKFSGSKPGVNLPVEFQDRIVGVIGITGDPEQVYRFGTILKMHVEVLLQQIYMNKQTHYRKMAFENWIMELISPNEFSEKRLMATAKRLDIDVDIPRCVMIVEIEELKWSEETLSVSSLQKLTDGKEQLLQELKNITDPKSLYTYIEDGTFFIAIPMKEGNPMSIHLNLIELLRKHEFLFYVGIGHVHSGLLGYRESYQQAQQSVSLMKKFNVSQKGCFIEEWGIVPYLNAIPQEIQSQYIQKYSRSSQTLSEDQKRTLQIYIECELDVKRTADLLHIHRNTLFYRLEKISQQLGLDYRKFNDLVIIKLLLIFDRLQP